MPIYDNPSTGLSEETKAIVEYASLFEAAIIDGKGFRVFLLHKFLVSLLRECPLRAFQSAYTAIPQSARHCCFAHHLSHSG
jgi:hypothetical protein